MGAAVPGRKENEASGTGTLRHDFLTGRELGTLAGDGVPLHSLLRGWGKGPRERGKTGKDEKDSAKMGMLELVVISRARMKPIKRKMTFIKR